MALARCAIVFCLLALAAAAGTQQTDMPHGRKLLQEVQSVEPYQVKAVEPVAGAQQIITPAPIIAPTCIAFTDAALRATRGVLCTSQHVSYNTTKIICNEWKPECRQTVIESRLVDPSAPGAAVDAYVQTATAACQLLGFSSFGSGTQHMIGAARDTCWNGKAWAYDNWFTNLVCCK